MTAASFVAVVLRLLALCIFVQAILGAVLPFLLMQQDFSPQNFSNPSPGFFESISSLQWKLLLGSVIVSVLLYACSKGIGRIVGRGLD